MDHPVRTCPPSDCLDTRAILRRLDRMIGFPEETALLLRDFELDSFSGVATATLICGGGVASNIRSGTLDFEGRGDMIWSSIGLLSNVT